MKRCYLCKKDKPRSDFHKCAGRTDGLQTKCKPCQIEYQRQRRKTAEGKAYDSKRRVMYSQTERGREVMKEAARRFRSRPEGAAKSRTWCQRYARENREKIRAHKRVSKAVAAGKIQRLPCEVCGTTPTDAHHHDYSKPLDVRWLCRFHHGEEHRKARA
jgi:hypothetical protein